MTKPLIIEETNLFLLLFLLSLYSYLIVINVVMLLQHPLLWHLSFHVIFFCVIYFCWHVKSQKHDCWYKRRSNIINYAQKIGLYHVAHNLTTVLIFSFDPSIKISILIPSFCKMMITYPETVLKIEVIEFKAFWIKGVFSNI